MVFGATIFGFVLNYLQAEDVLHFVLDKKAREEILMFDIFVQNLRRAAFLLIGKECCLIFVHFDSRR